MVELIVVIAILGILAGVGAVGYSGYIKKANEAADETLKSEIKYAMQLGLITEPEASAIVRVYIDPSKGTTVSNSAYVGSAPPVSEGGRRRERPSGVYRGNLLDRQVNHLADRGSKYNDLLVIEIEIAQLAGRKIFPDGGGDAFQLLRLHDNPQIQNR